MSGKCEEKRRPFSKLAFNGYLSAEELCVLFHDIESQAASVWIRVSPVTRLGEPIENGVEIFPRNADPVILYGVCTCLPSSQIRAANRRCPLRARI